MASFENTMGIDKIKMRKKLHNLCTIGQDWYTSNVEITFVPYKVIPDYMEIDKALDEIDEKELVVEEVVSEIVDILKKYNPQYIKVTNNVDDAKHLPVEVTKKYYKN